MKNYLYILLFEIFFCNEQAVERIIYCLYSSARFDPNRKYYAFYIYIRNKIGLNDLNAAMEITRCR